MAQAANGSLPPLPDVQGERTAVVRRQTKETSVEVRLNIDGTGICVANTPVGFLNHMLDQIASHGLFDVYVNAQGDTWIDDHHTVEDIALAFGTALSQALKDRKVGVRRRCPAARRRGAWRRSMRRRPPTSRPLAAPPLQPRPSALLP
jgi:imidazoleglycerol-phosphate dehydratase